MFSKIFLYLLAIGFGVFFALYMSASVGWTFVYILVCSPIFSFIVTLVIRLRGKVTVSVDVNRSMLYKGETAAMRIVAENKSILPVPAIKIKLFSPKGLECDKNTSNCVISIPPRSVTVLEINYKAKVWGICSIGAETVFLHDYMNFFRLSMPCENSVCEIKVFPDIPEIPGDSPLLRSAVERAKFSDDNEETKESDGSTNFGGMPGYTHREYIDGDPIKRINWKLSSKREKYMIRLDDEVETVQQTIVLDPCGGVNVFENERVVEGTLAAALGLLKCGFESTVYCRFGGVFEVFEITDPADVSALQVRYADYRFISGFDGEDYKGERIPVSVISESAGGKGILLYTSLFDRRLDGEIAAAEGAGISTAVISADSVSSGNAYQVWRLNEDHSADLVM